MGPSRYVVQTIFINCIFTPHFGTMGKGVAARISLDDIDKLLTRIHILSKFKSVPGAFVGVISLCLQEPSSTQLCTSVTWVLCSFYRVITACIIFIEHHESRVSLR